MSESGTLISLLVRYLSELRTNLDTFNDYMNNLISGIKVVGGGILGGISLILFLILSVIWFIIFWCLMFILLIVGGTLWGVGLFFSCIELLFTYGLNIFSNDNANAVNDNLIKKTNMLVDFFVGIKDCFVYYLMNPLISTLNVKTASVASIFFLILFILCIIAFIIYGLVYFANNIEITTKTTGIAFIIVILLISAFLTFYRVFQNFNADPSTGTQSSNPLFTKIMFLIAVFICILIFAYANPLKQTLESLSTFPVTVISIAIIILLVMSYNKFYFNKYSLQLAAFIVLVAMGIYYNPFSIFTTHVVPSIIMVAVVVSILILFMAMHQTTEDALNNPANGQLTFITVLSYAIMTGLMIGGGIYAHENHMFTSDPMFYILLTVTLSIIYKAIVGSGYAKNNPYITLLVDIIFYIPCILVNIIDYFSQAVLQTYSTTSKTMVILMVIEIALLILYLIVPYFKYKYYKYAYIGDDRHAKLLVNDPLRINSAHELASYKSLNCTDDATLQCSFDYNYGLSIWFNINAISPSAGAAYNEATQIFKYGDKMVVKYNPSINTLTVVAQTLNDAAQNNEKTVYTNENVMLQKWNHLVINYSSGQVDIFLNGELDGAAIKMLPFIQNDTLIIGTEDGISGKITGLIYFKQPMTAMAIKYMYDKFKTDTPPTFPEDVAIFSTDIYKNSKY